MWAQRCIRRRAECEPKSGYEPGKCSSIISAPVPFQALALIPLDDEFRGSGCKPNNLFLTQVALGQCFHHSRKHINPNSTARRMGPASPPGTVNKLWKQVSSQHFKTSGLNPPRLQ